MSNFKHKISEEAWKNIFHLLRDLRDLQNSKPRPALNQARVLAEAICKSLYLLHDCQKKNNGKTPEFLMLEELYNCVKSSLPRINQAQIVTIKHWGNLGSHDQGENNVLVTSKSIQPCINAAEGFTEWFVTEFSPSTNLDPLVLELSNSFRNKKKVTIKKIVFVCIFLLVSIVSTLTFLEKYSQQSISDKDKPIVISLDHKRDVIEGKFSNSGKQINPQRIAVLYFDNNSNLKELSALSTGLAEMIITDLKATTNHKIVERESLNKIFQELKLQKNSAINQASVQKFGKILGVEYLLMGSFFEFVGKLRLECKLVRVETGEIVISDGVDGSRDDFYQMEKKIVMRITKGMNNLFGEKNVPSEYIDQRNVPFKTISIFSNGLEALDNGNLTIAREELMKINDFQPARVILSSL